MERWDYFLGGNSTGDAEAVLFPGDTVPAGVVRHTEQQAGQEADVPWGCTSCTCHPCHPVICHPCVQDLLLSPPGPKGDLVWVQITKKPSGGQRQSRA